MTENLVVVQSAKMNGSGVPGDSERAAGFGQSENPEGIRFNAVHCNRIGELVRDSEGRQA